MLLLLVHIIKLAGCIQGREVELICIYLLSAECCIVYLFYLNSMGRVGTIMFIVFAAAWEIAVGLLYGFFFNYNEPAFLLQNDVTNVYSYANTSGTNANFQANTTQFPFPLAVVAIAIVLLIVGSSQTIQAWRWWPGTSSDRRLRAWPSRC
jgi:hypothetical protein